jgi:hypothetical protein
LYDREHDGVHAVQVADGPMEGLGEVVHQPFPVVRRGEGADITADAERAALTAQHDDAGVVLAARRTAWCRSSAVPGSSELPLSGAARVMRDAPAPNS